MPLNPGIAAFCAAFVLCVSSATSVSAQTYCWDVSFHNLTDQSVTYTSQANFYDENGTRTGAILVAEGWQYMGQTVQTLSITVGGFLMFTHVDGQPLNGIVRVDVHASGDEGRCVIESFAGNYNGFYFNDPSIGHITYRGN